MGRIHDFKRGGGTLVFVSHDPAVVERICDRAILLEGGQVVFDGTPDEIVARYHRLLADANGGLGAHLESAATDETGPPAYDPDAIPDSDVVRLTRVRLLRDGSAVANIMGGDAISLEITLESDQPIPDPVVGVSLALDNGLALSAASTRDAPEDSNVREGLIAALGEPGVPVTLTLDFGELAVQEGRIDVYVGVSSLDESRQFMGGRRVMSFSVYSPDAHAGLLAISTRWLLSQEQAET